MSQKVYVLLGETYSFDERTTWVVAVFLDKERALDRMERAAYRISAIHAEVQQLPRPEQYAVGTRSSIYDAGLAEQSIDWSNRHPPVSYSLVETVLEGASQ
jgi:hypothetical protein